MAEDERIRKLLQQLVVAAVDPASADVAPSTSPVDRVTEDMSGRCEKLRAAFDEYEVEHQLHAGQLVKWKQGLRNTRRPLYDEPAIVVKVLTEPIYDESLDVFSPYFKTPLDVVIGVIDETDGDFIMYHFDRRRFEPYP